MVDDTYDCMRLEAGEAFMPLTVERLYDNRFSIKHAYMQNGDEMRDPEMEFEVFLETKR